MCAFDLLIFPNFPLPIYLLFTEDDSLVFVLFKEPVGIKKTACSERIKTQFKEYFTKKRSLFDLKTSFVHATDFNMKVYDIIKTIPYGEVRSYKWVAEKLGSSRLSRAVGQALKKNPLPIIYPCHRVIGSDGSLHGFIAGVDIKRRLLSLENYLI
ncbi:MAG: MGMT family protein [Candidatus Magnetoovum sp. WYHC-5]|nr:MGMT family protein [Candidatus Magnetoovum sp. WYHC-5]